MEHPSARDQARKSFRHEKHSIDHTDVEGEKGSLHVPTKHSFHNKSIEHSNDLDGHVSFRQTRKHSELPDE